MTNARDKANIPVLNFQSKGIDDNADATAITIDSNENVGIGGVPPTVNQRLFIEGNNSALIMAEIKNIGGAVGLQLTADNGDAARVVFGDLADNGRGRIVYSNSDESMFFAVNNLSEKMRITSAGNLGIGLTNPTAKLHVQGSGTTAAIIKSLAPSTAASVGAINNSGTEGKILVFGSSQGSFGSIGSGEMALYSTSAGMSIINNNASGNIKFSLSSGAEKMRLTSTGFGIGTSSPSGNLEVRGSASDASQLYISTSTKPNSRIGYIGLNRFGMDIYDGLQIRDVSASYATRFVIDSSGNVGIGTTSPNSYSSYGVITLNGTTGGIFDLEVGGTRTGSLVANSNGVNLQCRTAQPLKFETNATERMRIDSSGNVGIGISNPSVKLQVDTPVQNAHVTNIKISQGGWSSSTNKLKSLAWGDPTTLASIGCLYDGNKVDMKWHSFYNGGYKTETTNIMTLTGEGNLSVSGSISKGSGSFTIDHPLPSKKETHNLVHSFVEAPQADNIYRGKIDLVNGTATINIDTNSEMSDGTFVLLNREIQCFTSNETGWTAVKGSVSGNTLTITAQDNTCTDTISWMVIGERQDQHMYDTEWTDENGKVIVEPLKETETTTP